ncbi:Uncharacterised protein [BD1-7 clade bacterium]|uniref:Oligosaccharide repeat unit polymerase n=1 Tax=BD1-7 clade bacterium TaxID=2029982 RepID=A0A5S9QYA6_9GAMM|nr:Uncharacterised protein [BD1-7 clade bacterium]
MFLKSTLFIAIPIVFFVTLFVDSYPIVYASLVLYLVFLTFFVTGMVRVICAFLVFYLSIGLLNISSWRGYIDIEVLRLYFFCIISFGAPLIMLAFYPPSNRKYGGLAKVANHQMFMQVMLVHLMIAYIGVLIVYMTNGVIILNQSLRFGIPTSLEYVIKSILPLAAFVPLLEVRKKYLLLLAILFPAILIGSRGTAIIAIISYLIAEFHLNHFGVKFRELISENKKYIVYGAGCLSIIVVGFYLRRGEGASLMGVSDVIFHYFDYDNVLIRAILPFYLGFKETIGLSNIIVTKSIVNNINDHALFFADLYTVLPGERLAAGQSLGRIFGAVQSGGLTPGLVGGVYIDYGILTPLFFLVFGVIFATSEYKLASKPLFIVIYAQLISQFIHLFHRGFIKPEYVTSVAIAIFYYLLCHRWIFRAEGH